MQTMAEAKTSRHQSIRLTPPSAPRISGTDRDSDLFHLPKPNSSLFGEIIYYQLTTTLLLPTLKLGKNFLT